MDGSEDATGAGCGVDDDPSPWLSNPNGFSGWGLRGIGDRIVSLHGADMVPAVIILAGRVVVYFSFPAFD